MTPLYSVGQVARAIGKSPDTVRRYVREGFVKVAKTDSGRAFTQDDIEVLRRVAMEKSAARRG